MSGEILALLVFLGGVEQRKKPNALKCAVGFSTTRHET